MCLFHPVRWGLALVTSRTQTGFLLPSSLPEGTDWLPELAFFYRGLRSSSQPQKQNEDEVPRGSSGLSLCPRLNLSGLSGVRREIIPLLVLWALSVKDHRELLCTGLTSWNPLGILLHP